MLSVTGIIQEDEKWPWGCSLWLVGSECGIGKEELRYVLTGCSGWYHGEQFHSYQIEVDAAGCSNQSNFHLRNI